MESSIPSGEESTRRCEVNLRSRWQRTAALRKMATRIQKDVRQCVPHFPRRPENVHVESICQDRTSPLEDSVHGSREPRTDRFHARSEIARARRLDDRVQMVVLNRVLHEAKPPPVTRRGEAALELADQPDRAKRG
jgi:hypothetical protein